MAKKTVIAADDGSEFHFSCPIVKNLGAFPITVNNQEFIVLMALVKRSILFFDPDNPRLWTSDEKLNYSNAGQSRIAKALQSGNLKSPTNLLKKQIEANGGQNEPLWVYSIDGSPTVVEGNRRLAIADWETVLVHIFPDEMPKECVFDYVEQRHNSGILEWPSVVRSKAAFMYLTERRLPMDQIMTKLQFKTVKDAEKYIHAYVWWKESGLGPEEWSKFHHLYTPTCVRHFGYDKNHWMDGSAIFKDELRKPTREEKRGGAITPQAVDKIVADSIAASGQTIPKNFKSDFSWFVKLVQDGKVTDCRHSDGIVGPILRAADMPWAEDVLKTLNSKPKTKHSKDKDREDGTGGLDPDTPAQMAWVQLKETKDGNGLLTKINALQDYLHNTVKSSKKLEKYVEETPENKLLDSAIDGLQALLTMFKEKKAEKIKKAKAKA